MSTGEKTIPIERFPEELHRFVVKGIETLGRELSIEVLHVFHREVVTRSPVGHPARDKHPGKFRASNTPSAGAPDFAELADLPSYPLPGADKVDALRGQIEPDMPLYESNAARTDGRDSSYAGVLEAGRHVDQNGVVRGSLQAEEGVYGPSAEATGAQSDTIAATAIRHTERLI